MYRTPRGNEVNHYTTDSKLLHSIVLHFIILETVMMEVSTKKFSSFLHPVSDTILKLLQSPETQGIKYKKETITTFRILSIFSCPKFSQNPTDYVFLSYFFPINDVFPLCKEAKLQARIKPTALCSVIDKENSMEFSLDFLHYLYNYCIVCALPSHVDSVM